MHWYLYVANCMIAWNSNTYQSKILRPCGQGWGNDRSIPKQCSFFRHSTIDNIWDSKTSSLCPTITRHYSTLFQDLNYVELTSLNLIYWKRLHISCFQYSIATTIQATSIQDILETRGVNEPSRAWYCSYSFVYF